MQAVQRYTVRCIAFPRRFIFKSITEGHSNIRARGARLAQVIFWVLGEYGAQADIGATGVMEKMAAVAERRSLSDTVRGYMLTAIAKLVAQVRAFCPVQLTS